MPQDAYHSRPLKKRKAERAAARVQRLGEIVGHASRPTSSLHRDDAAVYAVTQEAFLALERNRQARLTQQQMELARGRSQSRRSQSISRRRSASPRRQTCSPASSNRSDCSDYSPTQPEHEDPQQGEQFDQPMADFESQAEEFEQLDQEPFDQEPLLSVEEDDLFPFDPSTEHNTIQANFTPTQHDRGFTLPQVPSTLAAPQRLSTALPEPHQIATWVRQKEAQRQAAGLPIAGPAINTISLPPRPVASPLVQAGSHHRYDRESSYIQSSGPIPPAVAHRGGRRRNRRGRGRGAGRDLFDRISHPR